MSTGSIPQTTREAYTARAQDVPPAQPMMAGAPRATGLQQLSAALSSLLSGVAEIWQGVWSPGLNDSPRLSPLDIRDGGQHRR